MSDWNVKDGLLLLQRIHKGKQEFLDYIEWLNIHIDDEPMYEFFIGMDEQDVMEFVHKWDYDPDTFEDTVYDFANWLDEKEALAANEG